MRVAIAYNCGVLGSVLLQTGKIHCEAYNYVTVKFETKRLCPVLNNSSFCLTLLLTCVTAACGDTDLKKKILWRNLCTLYLL